MLEPAAADGARTVTVTTAGGTSGGRHPRDHAAGAGRADADQRRAESGSPGHDGGGRADRHQLRRRRHDGGRQRRRRDGQPIVVSSTTSLTANFVLEPAAADGARTVTVTTASGTSGGQTFTITLPAPGAPTLISVAPNQGVRGTTVAVALTGTNSSSAPRRWPSAAPA